MEAVGDKPRNLPEEGIAMVGSRHLGKVPISTPTDEGRGRGCGCCTAWEGESGLPSPAHRWQAGVERRGARWGDSMGALGGGSGGGTLGGGRTHARKGKHYALARGEICCWAPSASVMKLSL